jgi:hypothetical protein
VFEDCEGREIRLAKLVDKLLLERTSMGIGLALAAEMEMLPFLAPGRESSLRGRWTRTDSRDVNKSHF